MELLTPGRPKWTETPEHLCINELFLETPQTWNLGVRWPRGKKQNRGHRRQPWRPTFDTEKGKKVIQRADTGATVWCERPW